MEYSNPCFNLEWNHPLKSWEFLKFWDYFCKNMTTWDYDNSETVFPPRHLRFKALELVPFDKVKVVILGQDPYHTKGMAHGLAFSVPPTVKTLPPSLRRIFREYQDDLGLPAPRTGDLRGWAEQGVLLLNTILTVEEGKPLSHAKLGWEKLTYEVISALARKGSVVFTLWGQSAQEYTAACLDCPVVASPHPSPLAKGFLGSRPFTRTNDQLRKLGVEEVNWRL